MGDKLFALRIRPLRGSLVESLAQERIVKSWIGVFRALDAFGVTDGYLNVYRRRLSLQPYAGAQDYRVIGWPATWLLLLDDSPAAFISGRIPGVRVVD